MLVKKRLFLQAAFFYAVCVVSLLKFKVGGLGRCYEEPVGIHFVAMIERLVFQLFYNKKNANYENNSITIDVWCRDVICDWM